MNRFTRRIAAPLVAFALVGAACGGGGEDTTTGANEDPKKPTHGAVAVGLDTGAAALTQTLTDLFDGHVYLASIAVVQGLTNGLDSPEFEASAGTLDQNSQDLAAAIESVYGPDAAEQFLKQWRDHISFFVDYTKGVATQDEALANGARDKLENYTRDFAAFLDSATEGRLPADAGTEALKMHVSSLIGAIDAAAAGDPKVFDLVYAAASEHMPATASALAGAITAQFPEKFSGSVDSSGSQLQATLTDLLDGHVYLASITVVMGLTNGLDSPQFEASAGTLDQNSQDLAAAIESVYGADAGEQFLKQWRDHIGFFVDYTKGVATQDEALANGARDKLENYRQDFAAFLDSATGGKLPADAAADALQMHVNSLIGAIDAAAAGDPKVFDLVYAAATEHMPATASALAGAITAQFPEKFAA